MQSLSQVFIKSDVVKMLAQGALLRVEKDRQAAKFELVARTLFKMNTGFWHKLFRRKAKTETDALLKLTKEQQAHQGVVLSELDRAASRGGSLETLALNLLAAAKRGEGVYLSVEDLSRLE
jgi:hypothetical protein